MAKSFAAQMAVRFTKITSDYGKINAYVHETGVLILKHAKEHGDCSTAQGLINAMPQSARKLALINWFHKFSPIVVKDDDKWQSKMHKEGTKLFVPFDIEAAEATPWYSLADNMGAEKPPMDFAAMLKLIESLANKLEKGAEEGKVLEEDIPSALAAAKALRGLKIKRINPANVNNESEDEGDKGVPAVKAAA